MTEQTIDGTTVRREITVAVSPERAFEVFTARISSWWPGDKSIGAAPMESCAERHGPGWEGMHAAVDSPGGWTGILADFADAAG